MSKVYIVTEGEYSDYHIEAVFSTKEAAENFVNGNDEFQIEEWPINELKGDRKIVIHRVFIYLGTGAVESGFSNIVLESDYKHMNKAKDYPDGYVEIVSPKSRDHAVKLAVEYRQKWLRNNKNKGK